MHVCVLTSDSAVTITTKSLVNKECTDACKNVCNEIKSGYKVLVYICNTCACTCSYPFTTPLWFMLTFVGYKVSYSPSLSEGPRGLHPCTPFRVQLQQLGS